MKTVVYVGLISVLYFSYSLTMEKTQENRIGQKLKDTLIVLSGKASTYLKDYPKYTPLMKAAEKATQKLLHHF